MALFNGSNETFLTSPHPSYVEENQSIFSPIPSVRRLTGPRFSPEYGEFRTPQRRPTNFEYVSTISAKSVSVSYTGVYKGLLRLERTKSSSSTTFNCLSIRNSKRILQNLFSSLNVYLYIYKCMRISRVLECTRTRALDAFMYAIYVPPTIYVRPSRARACAFFAILINLRAWEHRDFVPR